MCQQHGSRSIASSVIVSSEYTCIQSALTFDIKEVPVYDKRCGHWETSPDGTVLSGDTLFAVML